ncbi:MAG: radical SAM protein [Myxococcales bacterium]|nr:radical SAM protein [Myxococcales bacterium]
MLRLIELFNSVQGEGSHAGLPCSFVRLATCNLRCVYCDTPHSFGDGEPHDVSTIVERVAALGSKHVCVTGGEPMLQREGCISLMTALLERGHTVLLETHGAVSLEGVPDAVVRIMDVKTPDGLGFDANSTKFKRIHFDYTNLERLKPHDEVKFVLMGRRDYEWARAFVAEHRLMGRVRHVLFSPSFHDLPAKDLVDWILEDRLPVRLNLQTHKYIWGPDVQGV